MKLPGPTYFILNDMLADVSLGFSQSQIWRLPRTGVSWISGHRHERQFHLPIEVHLNPEFGTELLDSYHESIPIWSNRLVSALHSAGVDNLDLYPAVIRDQRTGLVTSEYKAVNVIGLVDCCDMVLSEYDARSERGAREFYRLVLDPRRMAGLKLFRLLERPTLVVVDDSVRAAVEAESLRGVRADPVELTPA